MATNNLSGNLKNTRKRRYKVEELLYAKGGREYFLNIRNKMLRKFEVSTSAWDKWLKKTNDSHVLGDFPPVILMEIAKELNVPMEELFNAKKEHNEISL